MGAFHVFKIVKVVLNRAKPLVYKESAAKTFQISINLLLLTTALKYIQPSWEYLPKEMIFYFHYFLFPLSITVSYLCPNFTSHIN